MEGSRNITIGRSADGRVIVTGDNNLVYLIQNDDLPLELKAQLESGTLRPETVPGAKLDPERRHFRIFLSSPSDVLKERELARALIKDVLSVEPFIRDRVTLNVVSWDDEHAAVTMPAHLTPQEALNKSLPKPSECDIVVVILWSWMGTPLPPEFKKANSERYLSGTEWEFVDALEEARKVGKPVVLLYKRTEEPVAKLSDPEFDAKREQFRQVELFFDQFRNPDGSLSGGVHTYHHPNAFRDLLRQHLLQTIYLLVQPANQIAKSATAPAFQGRIEAFFDEYLKSEMGPVPFGGRDQELAHLDSMLEDERSAGRWLVAGPAGRGKSALLVRWVERLQRRGLLTTGQQSSPDRWHLVFVPISIRFNTNTQQTFYQALAERLAIVAGQMLERPAINATGYYADKASDLIRELAQSPRRVLIVLDGLDEALHSDFDSTIFPPVLPPTIRVVVSARWQLGDSDSTGWLDRLNWKTSVRCAVLDLKKLDTAAIGHVLIGMGAPLDILSTNRALVQRLADLTEGEPLLLHFYALDLWHMGEEVRCLTLADLDRRKPGFGAYFDHWLELQRKAWRDGNEYVNPRDIDPILTILAFAHGPLEGSDLLRLSLAFPGSPRAFLPAHLLEPLRRFVIGDGSRERGFVLSHPKIGEHLRTERFRDAAPRVKQAFIEWGKQVVSRVNGARDQVVDAPRYLLHFYRHHLQDEQAATPHFMELVQDGWRRAWDREDGSQQGFASDVQAAWDSLRKQGVFAHLGCQFRCMLTLSSIRSLASGMPQSLIVEAARRNVLSLGQAAYLASLMADEAESVVTMGTLAVEFERDEAKDDLLNQAFTAAKSIGHDYRRAYALGKLATYLTKAQLAEALATAKAIYRDIPRALALGKIGHCLTGHERRKVVREALGLARASDREELRVEALSQLAGHLTNAQRAEVLQTATAIRDEIYRASALINLAKYLNRNQLGDALRVAIAINDQEARACVLKELAPHLTGKQLTAALSGAMEIVNEDDRALALSGFAAHLAHEKLVEEFTAAKAIGDQHLRAQALKSLASHLTSEQLAEAVTAAKSIGAEYARIGALSEIATQLTGEQRDQVVIETRASVEEIGHKDGRALALNSMATHLTHEQRADALAATATIGREINRLVALGSLIKHLTPAQLTDALAVAEGIGREDIRASALRRLVPHLTSDHLPQVLAAVKAIRDEFDKAGALGLLSTRLTGDSFIEALSVAKAISHEDARTVALCGFAENLSENRFAELLTAVKAIREDFDRAQALSLLAMQVRGDRLAEVLMTARAIRDQYARGYALELIAPHLTSELSAEALAAAKAIGDERARAGALSEITRHLSEPRQKEAFAAFLSVGDRLDRLRFLRAVQFFISTIFRVGGERALLELRAAIRDTATWYP